MSKPILDLKRDALGRFVVGTESPRRQVGQRNRFSERFIRDLHDFWREQGPQVIRLAAMQNPSSFIRSMAIYLRPTLSSVPDVPEDMSHLHTVEDVLEEIRRDFGPEVAKAMMQAIEGPKRVTEQKDKP